MSWFLRMLPIFLLAASCSMGNSSPPSNVDNACTIIREKPKYYRAFKRTERRWNVPVHVQMATIHQESKFVKNARAPRRRVLGFIPWGRQSSAYGYSQAIDGTWDEYRKSTGKQWSRRNNIWDAADFMGWYMNRTRTRTGVRLNDTRNQYLAYHEGHAGYRAGTHWGKPWLLRTANGVASRASLYERQLRRC